VGVGNGLCTIGLRTLPPTGHRTEAKAATTALVLNRRVSVHAVDYDRCGRTVAFVGLPDGRDLGSELVRAGAAWHYVRYSQDAELGKREAAARSARVGLWADPLPEAYRAVRRGHSARRRQRKRWSEQRSWRH
jgi:endonuclease YncB( thermonuclease family)